MSALGVAMRRRPGRRQRLLVAIPGYEYGGAERYAVRIAAGAVSRFDVAAAVRPVDTLRPLREDLASAGVRTLQMVRGRRARGVLGFAAMIGLYQPDVVHIALPWPLFAGELRAACALTSVPTVLVHQLVPRADELDIRYPRFYSWTRSRHQTWVAVSQYGRRTLADAFALPGNGEMPVIYNAPGAPSGGVPCAAHQARLEYGLAPDDQVVVSVGRLSHQKGHDVLIEAASRVRERLPRLRMLIAGSGELHTPLEDAIAAGGLEQHVRLVGQVGDIGSLLCAADVFAFPSRREGTPFAMLEAMSLGLPVVATRFGGADEIIESDVNGILVPMDDPARLAAALEATLRDPDMGRAIGERARLALGRFSEEEMLTQTLELLARAANGRGSHETGD